MNKLTTETVAHIGKLVKTTWPSAKREVIKLHIEEYKDEITTS